MLTHLSNPKQKQLLLPFATAACQVSSKKTTLNDKLTSCEASTRMPKSSVTLAVDLTVSEKDCVPYWNGLSKVINSKLWLPIGIVSPASATTLLPTFSNKTVANSWFSTIQLSIRHCRAFAPKKRSGRIFSRSCMSSVADYTASANTVIKSKKIRIYPTAEQRKTLRQWIGTARFVYNRTIAHLQAPDTKASWFAIKTELLNDLPEWSKPVPYQVKSSCNP